MKCVTCETKIKDKSDIDLQCDFCDQFVCKKNCSYQYVNICQKCVDTKDYDYCRHSECQYWFTKGKLNDYNNEKYCDSCINYIIDNNED